MKDEHFGISVVEMMAAGLITIAHNSAGPKMDIIGSSKEHIGYLAEDSDQYANYLRMAMLQFDKDYVKRNEKVDAHIERFSTEEFKKLF